VTGPPASSPAPRRRIGCQAVQSHRFVSSDPFVASLEVGYLAFRFLTSNPVALLNFTYELIASSFNDLPVIVGQLAPFLFGLADELFPVTFDLIGFHLEPLKLIRFTNSVNEVLVPPHA
jgi:hypothetical protein